MKGFPPPRLHRAGVVHQDMTSPKKPSPDIKSLAKDLRAGGRAAAARDLVQALLPDTGKAIRVGITGSPGVGKSTTIDALGMFLIERGHNVAGLAGDPPSARTGGALLRGEPRM